MLGEVPTFDPAEDPSPPKAPTELEAVVVLGSVSSMS
jgi:hypothetical protein